MELVLSETAKADQKVLYSQNDVCFYKHKYNYIYYYVYAVVYVVTTSNVIVSE